MPLGQTVMAALWESAAVAGRGMARASSKAFMVFVSPGVAGRWDACGANGTPQASGGQAVTTTAFLMKSGSISTPKPGPLGTWMTPLLSLRRLEVGQWYGSSLLNSLNSWKGPELGMEETKCIM